MVAKLRAVETRSGVMLNEWWADLQMLVIK
jgi:hypothetical protein